MPVTILAFALIFSAVVFVHELGHFVVAKLAGVRVDEFGIGYPPRLLRLGKRGDTEYTINAIPIGGFVRVLGDETPEDPRSLARKGPWLRGAFLVAGPAMNVALAVVLFATSLTLGVLTPVGGPGMGVYAVAPGSPAAKAGLRVGDTILEVDGTPVNSVASLHAVVAVRLDREIALKVSRNGEVLAEAVRLVPRSVHPQGQGAMGIAIGEPLGRIAYPPWEALWLGLQRTGWTVLSIIGGLVAMVRGYIPADLTGPIGIAQMTAEVARSGAVQLVEWTAFLSINLFIINLLPIPALDGGRLVFVALEIVRRGRRIDPRKEGFVHFVGIVLLLALFLVISYFDLVRIVQGTPLPGP
ncbi:MAG: RIP metalloprotease RseP [Anaerolineae bacterium]|nr:RIP metalloprotease RseP [Anaerolineae bacterium]